MSTCYRIKFGNTWNRNMISITQLLSECKGLIEVDTTYADNKSMFVSTNNIEGGCWFYFRENGFITGFTRYGGNYDSADAIINEIDKLGDVRVISEHEPDYHDYEFVESLYDPIVNITDPIVDPEDLK